VHVITQRRYHRDCLVAHGDTFRRNQSVVASPSQRPGLCVPKLQNPTDLRFTRKWKGASRTRYLSRECLDCGLAHGWCRQGFVWLCGRSFDCAGLQSSEQETGKGEAKARADALFSHDSDIKEFCSHTSGKVAFLNWEGERGNNINTNWHVSCSVWTDDLYWRENQTKQRTAACVHTYHCALKGAGAMVGWLWWLNWDTCSNVQFCITSWALCAVQRAEIAYLL